MKKMTTAILLFIFMVGLLFLGLCENRMKEESQMGAATAQESGGGSGISVAVDGSGYAALGEEENVKKIALTFDDGPHPYYTEQLLDGLKERGVVATFFVTGEHASLHPEVIKRMHEDGHLIGNHTYSHIQLRSTNLAEFKEELVATSQVLEEIIGEEVNYVRPPYGSWDKSLEKELNMFPVLWTVDPLDWCSENVSCIVDKVVTSTGENDIILLHDYFETSVTAALKIVDELLAKGYTFVTVEEILFE